MNGIAPHPLGDVLDLLLAEVLVAEAEDALDLLVDGPGDADPARFGQALEAGRHVHAVAVDVLALDDDLAEIDADAEVDLAVVRDTGVARGHRLLNLDGRLDGLGDAVELGQESVAGGLDDAAAVFLDLRVDEFVAQRLEADQSAGLVDLHQSRIAGDVGGDDGRQPALDGSLLHWACPSQRESRAYNDPRARHSAKSDRDVFSAHRDYAPNAD